MTWLPPAIKTHPLYRLRRGLLLTTLLSYFFATLSISITLPYHSTAPYVYHLVLSTLSAFLNIYELARWGIAKFHDPDTQPTYPLKRVLAADIGFAVVFVVVFIAELGEAISNPDCYAGGGAVTGAYASMASKVTVVLHTICAWRQVMALKRMEWEGEVMAVEARDVFGRYLGTRCVSCGGRGVGGCARNMPTPMSSGGLDLASGCEVIPDKMPEAGSSVTGKKGKGTSRANSQTSLMEV
jgi:hypothetical protein